MKISNREFAIRQTTGYKPRQSRLAFQLLKVSVIMLFGMLIFSLLSSHRAYANSPTALGIPYDIQYTSTSPENLYTFDTTPPPAYPWLGSWISLDGNSADDTSISVPQGSPSINLQLNSLIFLWHDQITNCAIFPTDGVPFSSSSTGPDCSSSAANASQSEFFSEYLTQHIFVCGLGCNSGFPPSVSSSLGGSVSSIAGSSQTIGYSASTRYWQAAPVGFTYTPSGGFSTPGTYVVQINLSVDEYTNWPQNPAVHQNQCDINNSTYLTPADLAVFWPAVCQAKTVPFDIDIVVTPTPHKPSITIAATSTCSTLNFTAEDSSDSGDPLTSVSITVSPNQPGAPNPTATNIGGYDYSSDISPWIGYQAETFTITAADSAGSSTSTYSVGPCATFTCGTLTSPTADLGGTYSLQTSIDENGVGGTGSPGADGAPPVVGSSGNYIVNGAPETYTVNGLTSVQNTPISVSASSPGVITVTWSFSYNGVNTISSPCQYTYTVVAQPYFRAYGGDVMAGVDSQYPASCFDNPAGIYSFNNGTPVDAGAGTSEAALATNSVSGFASGQSNNPPLLLSMLNPLTFSNTSLTPGDYGSGSGCSGTDYYDLSTAPTCSPSVISGLTITAGTDVVPGLTITAGNSVICKTTNNVEITGPITYNLVGATASTMPVFEVITQGGNINIDTSVDNLAGTYIAEQYKGSGGTICDSWTGGPTGSCQVDPPGSPDNPSNTTNDDRLTVDGNFIANQIDLYRSYGSINDALTSTSPPDPNDSEEFDYSPINWLVPSASSTTPTVQAITSLPPVL